MNKNRVCAVIALLVFGAFGAAVAVADEMTVPPALAITGPTSWRPWNGVYFGVNAGYGFSSSSVSYAANDPAAQAGTCGRVGHSRCIPWTDYHTQGGLFGGQIGYNYQINSILVTGVEADYQGADLTGQGVKQFRLGYTIPSTTSVNTSAAVDQSVKSFGTVRLRLGAASVSPLFVYGTGGLAFGQLDANLNMSSGGAGALSRSGYSYSCGAAGSTCFSGSTSKSTVGWTLGVGAEYALSNNFTLKGEALYVDLGGYTATVTAANGNGNKPASFMASLSPVGFVLARGGLNFRF